MPESPLILVTNDDGLLSPGLHAAAEAVAGLGEIKKSPAQAGITRFGKPEEIADRHSNSRQAVSRCISDPSPIVCAAHFEEN